MRLSTIQIRDPFVLPLPGRREYLLFGTTDKNGWTGPAVGFDSYRSRNLLDWEGPIPAFRPPPGFWATKQYWAPEVRLWHGQYCMFASFKADGHGRGTQILVSHKPEGPCLPPGDGPVTPPEWEFLDGTLHLDTTGQAWLVFSHEWVQIGDGEMAAIPLSRNLLQAVGPPVKLFAASQAPWTRPLKHVQPQMLAQTGHLSANAKFYVTDGPFLHRTTDQMLLMLWSSFGQHGYAMGLARSITGTVLGPWNHDSQPLWAKDGGHGMLFRNFAGELYVALHQPNQTPHERATFHRMNETAPWYGACRGTLTDEVIMAMARLLWFAALGVGRATGLR